MGMDFLKLAKERYSVRQFKDKPVETEKLEKILQAGHAAPTACNRQPQRILVINSKKNLEKLKLCTRSHFNAPAALIVCYDKNECWVRSYDQKDSGYTDASIVTTHMMLQACELGIGTTWVMSFDPKALRNEFEVPDNFEPAAILVMGYPAEDAVPSPMHTSIKPAEELVFYNKF